MGVCNSKGIETSKAPGTRTTAIGESTSPRNSTHQQAGAKPKMLTKQEVSKHNNATSCWIIHEGKVYDVTRFLEEHPGGKSIIVLSAGTDATDDFNGIHSQEARAILNKYYVGELEGYAKPAPPAPPATAPSTSNGNASQPAAAPAPQADNAPSTSAPAPTPVKRYTKQEVSRHNNSKSCWVIHEGKVYDVTRFLEDHPGGSELILFSAGMDATDDFNAIHSPEARAMLDQYFVGELEGAAKIPVAADVVPQVISSSQPVAAGSASSAAAATAANSLDSLALSPPTTLKAHELISLTLTERVEINHNTRIFRFALPSPKHVLGLPCGSHVLLRANVGGEVVMRAYTPISGDDDDGKLDLLIKVYFATSDQPGGKMSQHLDTLRAGDSIQVKGPLGHFHVKPDGSYIHRKAQGKAKRLAMVAGGTGITPMYQVIKELCKDPSCDTSIRLLYANQTEEDILLRKELDALAAKHPGKLVIHHVVSKPSMLWPHARGRISQEMMRALLFPAMPDTLGLVCGPPGLVEQVCLPGLQAMGYDKEHTVVF